MIKNIKSLAATMGCSYRTVQRHLAAGLLPPRRVGGWREDEVTAALARELPLVRRPGRPGRPSLVERAAAAARKGGA